ncbi:MULTISPECIES: ComEC/Rec2 family competence protein [unclassified Fictibacillus]|uniref:ComEC/Rec2 family competence protein n=1 Tax=unclassified Fictibacillus TaxID=2644029 RepID=UPI000782517E|nr:MULTISPECIES: MBL fold metallo-hydrolase [unclassified Fictibacillus]MED2972108.1 MBL fold metallo-hydrolase [Fictibacillus sp. B-59209]
MNVIRIMKQIVLAVILSAAVLCISPKIASAAWFEPLKVHFLDVGQADCILIQMPNGRNMLVDAGDENDGPEIIRYLQSQGVVDIDVLVATHPHHDHIGSMDDVIRNFNVKKIYMPNLPYDTAYYHDLFKIINEKNIPVERAKAGTKFRFGFSVKVDMLAPGSAYYKYINDYSAVLRITHGKNRFLLMADAGMESEKELLSSKKDLKANVIKIGHHGANTGTTMAFLKAVHAKTAMISVGNNNPYHYPSKEVLFRLERLNMTIYRTDQLGVITAISNGNKITFRTNGFK